MPAFTNIVCPRCGRRNASRARFCAQCGLNLVASGGSEVEQPARRTKRKSGTGMVLFVILLGLFLAAMASLFRSRPCAVPPQLFQPDVPQVPMQGEPWTYEEHRKVERPMPERWGWKDHR